jgi:hypothetical protein
MTPSIPRISFLLSSQALTRCSSVFQRQRRSPDRHTATLPRYGPIGGVRCTNKLKLPVLSLSEMAEDVNTVSGLLNGPCTYSTSSYLGVQDEQQRQWGPDAVSLATRRNHGWLLRYQSRRAKRKYPLKTPKQKRWTPSLGSSLLSLPFSVSDLTLPTS